MAGGSTLNSSSVASSAFSRARATASRSRAASTAAPASSPRSATGPTHGDPGDAKAGRSAAHGNALTVLAAHALPRVEIVGDGVDRRHDLDGPAGEVGAANRRGDLAPFDEVPLRHAEHEVARGRVGLPAAQGC